MPRETFFQMKHRYHDGVIYDKQNEEGRFVAGLSRHNITAFNRYLTGITWRAVNCVCHLSTRRRRHVRFNTRTHVWAPHAYSVYLCCGTNPVKGGARCQRISQIPFDSQEQLYLNKAEILRENPSNLLIPISVFGLGDSSILFICFCLSEAAGGFQSEWHFQRYSAVRSCARTHRQTSGGYLIPTV